MFRVCHTVLSAQCSLVVTCWERVNLLTLLCVIFSCVFVTCPWCVLGLVSSVHDLCILPYFTQESNNGSSLHLKFCSVVVAAAVVVVLFSSPVCLL